MHTRFNKYVCLIVVLSLLVLNVGSARAGLVPTETAVNASRNAENRAFIKAQLQREDVRQVLAAQGVTPAEVEQRVDALSDAEVAKIADRVADMPAGGGALGLIVGAALFVFVVLLITDICGWTDVYPFVKKAH